MLSKKYKDSKKGPENYLHNFPHQEGLKCCLTLKINKKHITPGTGDMELISVEAPAFMRG